MAIAFVNGQTATGTSSPTTSAILSTTAGNTLVMVITDDSGVTTNSYTVSDTAGNTWTQRKITATTITQVVYTAENVLGGGTNVFSVAWNTVNTSNLSFAVQQFSGAATAPVDIVSTPATGTSLAPASGTTATTTQANEMIVPFLSYGSTISTTSLGTGYSNLTVRDAVMAAALENKRVTATGTQSGGFSLAASRSWICGIITLKELVAGGSTAHNLLTMGVGK